jgi:tRNA dimethylallyltransferase
MAAKNIAKLVVIVGPTGSGKTELAIKIAKKFNGEIINADSWAIRKCADIGTAKPSLSEQMAVKHYLIDIIEPDESFNAAMFKKLALRAINTISKQHKLPILVGGSGLYIDGLLYDYSFLPPSNLRKQLNKLSVGQLASKAMDLKLIAKDIDLKNKRHLIRLIESNGERPSKKNLRSNTIIIGLKTDRSILKDRLIKRTDTMIKKGLEYEVLGLVERYGWKCEALKGVNYAQWKDYFIGKDDLDKTKQKLIKANFDLAKKQMTWFKRNKSIHWMETPVKLTDVVDLLTTFLNK